MHNAREINVSGGEYEHSTRSPVPANTCQGEISKRDRSRSPILHNRQTVHRMNSCKTLQYGYQCLREFSDLQDIIKLFIGHTETRCKFYSLNTFPFHNTDIIRNERRTASLFPVDVAYRIPLIQFVWNVGQNLPAWWSQLIPIQTR